MSSLERARAPQIVPDVRTRLLDMFYGIYRKDTDAVIRWVGGWTRRAHRCNALRCATCTDYLYRCLGGRVPGAALLPVGCRSVPTGAGGSGGVS
jgi:hypothetical protein